MVEARQTMVPDRVRKLQEERAKALADRRKNSKSPKKQVMKAAADAAAGNEEVKSERAPVPEGFTPWDPAKESAVDSIDRQIREMDAKFAQLRSIMVAKFGTQAIMAEAAVKAKWRNEK